MPCVYFSSIFRSILLLYAVAIEYPVLNNKDYKGDEDFEIVALSAFLLYRDKQLW